MVDDCRGVGDGRVGVGHGRPGVERADSRVDGSGADERLVALDVDDRTGSQVSGGFGEAVGACRVLAGHEDLHVELPAGVGDALVVGGDPYLVDQLGGEAGPVGMPHQGPASEGRKGFAREAGGPVPARDDGHGACDHPAIVRFPGRRGNRGLRFDLVLFDLDGVLVDTLAVMRVAWAAVQRAHGIVVPFEAYAAHLGLPFPDIMRALGLGSSPGLQATYETAASAAKDLASPFPGIRPVLASLMAGGCRLGVVTSKSRRRAVPLVEMLGVAFVTVCTPEDGPGKPAPDGLLTAVAEAAVDRSRAVYVGDMPADQQAARRAGVAYAHAGWGYGEPRDPRPSILATPADLLALCLTGREVAW